MRVKRLKGHSAFVNSCCPTRRGPELIVSGSDDGTVKASKLAPMTVNDILHLVRYADNL